MQFGKKRVMNMELTPEERRRIRLAKNIARGVRYFLYFVIAAVVALVAAGLWISLHGG